MAYAVGQTVKVCLEFDLPLTRGVRRVVATFANGHGDVAELIDVPAGASECVGQEPTQTSLQGRVAYPGFHGLKRLWVEHLRGVTHLDPPGIGFEVRGAPKVVGWRLK
ncbi:MAG: hypothetical protein M3397_01780 [Actinomycetota bacterium]|jgi:hypothetical protein|nr:hypothetical protein [Actinomycetota bacterium]